MDIEKTMELILEQQWRLRSHIGALREQQANPAGQIEALGQRINALGQQTEALRRSVQGLVDSPWSSPGTGDPFGAHPTVSDEWLAVTGYPPATNTQTHTWVALPPSAKRLVRSGAWLRVTGPNAVH